MKKQTAVEWLIEQICGDHTSEWNKQIEQAKAMEREQIIESYGVGHNDGCAYMTDGKTEFINSDQYYNETYKGGEQ